MSPLYVRINGRWVLYSRDLWNQDPDGEKEECTET